MNVEEFLKSYEIATNTHVRKNVEPLIADDAIYRFSDGSYRGKEEIKQAFEETFEAIQDEIYNIQEIERISVTESNAVCIYRFFRKGIVEGVRKEGNGRGTNILVKRDGKWFMIHEHLSVPS